MNKKILNWHEIDITNIDKKEMLTKWQFELDGQRVFYKYMELKKITGINWETLFDNQSDGIVESVLFEHKLDESGDGIKKAYFELFTSIPMRIKSKGQFLPFYRIYIELNNFYAEVYDNKCVLVEKFDWFYNPEKFQKYINSGKFEEYDLNDEQVNIVEVIQNMYDVYLEPDEKGKGGGTWKSGKGYIKTKDNLGKTNLNSKKEAMDLLQKGIAGWFKPLDFTKVDINLLIKNNDRMNEKYVQKIQGAFFTPSKYVEISTKMVVNAIEQSKTDGYDNFVIVDRCAGVGNLESQFINSVEKHMILGTINEAEARILDIRFNTAKCAVEDALTEKGVGYYLEQIEIFKQKNKVKKLAVIFLENPPFVFINSNKKGGVGEKINKKNEKTWVHKQMSAHEKMKHFGNDYDEQFVFSAFEYYVPYRYIHYGPIGIWKSRHMIDKKVCDSYLCNKKFFNAGISAIALISWSNEDQKNEELSFKSDFCGDFVVKKVHKTISELYVDDGKKNGVCVIEARNYSFLSPRLTGSLNDNEKYGKKWVNKQNLLKVLPLFCAARNKFAETGILEGEECDYRVVGTVYKTADGGIKYQKNTAFLQNCLLYSLCTNFNQCSSKSSFWRVGEELLNESKKNNEIWTLYKKLVELTGVNGLYNIEKIKKDDLGKLWKEHSLFPITKNLKQKLNTFCIEKIQPNLFKYELLK